MAAKRGEFMDEAASHCTGGMLAVLFTPLSKVNEVLAAMNRPQHIVLANDNAPDQIVVSGALDALEEFSRRLRAEGVGKTKSILVSGPWHSPYMQSARDTFALWVQSIGFGAPKIPLMLNAAGEFVNDPATIKQLITEQLVRPVFWRSCMEALRAKTVDAFFEIGPQRILSGLVRVNGFPKTTSVYNVNNLAGLERALQHAASRP